MKTPNKKYFEHPEKYIPLGVYCYSGPHGTDRCPFWDYDEAQEEQNWGYCHYLERGDWMNDSFGLLWDQCKECGVNDNWDEEENIAI